MLKGATFEEAAYIKDLFDRMIKTAPDARKTDLEQALFKSGV